MAWKRMALIAPVLFVTTMLVIRKHNIKKILCTYTFFIALSNAYPQTRKGKSPR